MPGVYAAWIVDPAALAEAGIDGPPPVLMYVGKASSTGGLKARLRLHASWPWWELIDLLATRRTVLPGWWSHAQKNTQRRTLTVPPLAAVSQDQARAWQWRNLRWGWISDPSMDLLKHEAALIASHRPMLNRRGLGYQAQGPTQLQRIGAYEEERAGWLFHVSWLAVLTLQPDGWVQRSRRPWSRSTHVACDGAGWPVPLLEGATHAITIPDERSARKALAAVAPSELRVAITDSSTSAEQATAWWAAYAGHPFLVDSQPREDALRAALARRPHRGPPTLPSESGCAALIELVRRLPGVNH